MADPSYHYPPPQAHPHRKPLPHLQPQRPYPSEPEQSAYGHSRSRTTSSNVFPTNQSQQQQQQQKYSPAYAQQNAILAGPYTSRRTPSTNTFSTIASSGNGPVPMRQSMSSNFSSSSTANDLRRSTSSRSGGSQQPTSYVALMRKQKATVWCDRAQHEDPRLLAARRAAKIRAANEVLGSHLNVGGRATTSGSGSIVGSNRVTAKIRHHGKAGLVGFTGHASSTGQFGVGVGGVPMRLSASEVEGGSDEEDDDGAGGNKFNHHRSGSGRSSLGSGTRGLMHARQSGASGASGRWSSGNTPPSERESAGSLHDLTETPVPVAHARKSSVGKDYFTVADGRGLNSLGGRSTGSGSSGEKRDGVPELDNGSAAARLASRSLLANTNLVAREKSVRNPEELRRRGSVDERTMTMSAGRLFVANPDEDSD
ncbi:MAG: hypothetical protein M1818_004575 [Claussenomyces sp. TS43310]|nr:MAG: hypothetical protein M1818_004575 [Claussenomyces sp. TS43310]